VATAIPGTYRLAQKIAGVLLPQLSYSPELRLIMDAIADNSFGVAELRYDWALSADKGRSNSV
jgi:hypothetical protein